MDFGLLPPEINANRLFRGPGTASLLAAAMAWEAIAKALYSAEIGYVTEFSRLGPMSAEARSGNSPAEAVRPYLTWLRLAVVRANLTAAQARSAATAYETALMTTVQPTLITANRQHLRCFAAANHFAQLSPAIAALEATYSEMWARAAGAMYRYARDAAMATQLSVFPAPPTGPTTAAPSGDTATPTTQKSDMCDELYQAAPRALLRRASPTPYPSNAAPSDGDSTDRDIAGMSSPMLQVPALITQLSIADDQRCATGRTRPMAVRASFSARQDLRGFRPRATIGIQTPSRCNTRPATLVGRLSVPQTWIDKTPPRRVSVASASVSESDSGPGQRQ